jgi:hypothetical protein
MNIFQRGQAMAEYTVVSLALVSTLLAVDIMDCPGYDNCISKLTSVVHN